MKKTKRIVSLILAFVMTASLFTNWDLKAFATDTISEPVVESIVAESPRPTTEPTATPTVEPTAQPTAEPTATPTAQPTTEPTPTPVPGITLDTIPAGAVASSETPSGALAAINSLSANTVALYGIPFDKAVFTSDEAIVYTGDASMTPKTITGLTEEDILEFKDYDDSTGYEYEGMHLYYVENYLGDREDLKTLFNTGSRVLVNVATIKEYTAPSATPTPTPTPTPVPGPTEEEIAESFEFIIQSGLLKDFEESYARAQENGTLDSMTAEQLAEINSIKATLEEMAENTADWTEIAAEATISENGVKIYRNPVTRPDDYVLANVAEVNAEDDEVPSIEEISIDKAEITGKYESDDGTVYYILNTDNWLEFEGRVPYRFIEQSQMMIVENWIYLERPGVFLTDTVKLYTESQADSEYVEITNGLSLGAFNIYYEILKTDFTGAQEKWYWIGTPNWTDANGNDVGYSRYVKAEDVHLVTALTDATGVSVYGNLPEDVTLTVTPETASSAGIVSAGDNSLFYDVKLTQNGAEYQPESITITFPEDKIPFERGTYYNTYHVHGDTLTTEGPFLYEGGPITVTYNGLSVVGITEDVTTDNLTGNEFAITITHTSTGVSVRSADEKMADVRTITVTEISEANNNIPEGTENYLIWKDSYFYDIVLKDAAGQEIELIEKVTVSFPIPQEELEQDMDYTAYRFNDDGTVTAGDAFVSTDGDEYTMAYEFDGLSVVGVAKEFTTYNNNLSFVDEEEPVRVEFINSPATLYADYALTQPLVFTPEETYTMTVHSTAYYTYGEETKTIYLIDTYEGADTELSEKIIPSDGITPGYWYVLVDDVQEYDENEITTAEQALTALLATTTSEEFKEMYLSLSFELREAFTFEQGIQLFEHRLALLIAELIDQPQDYEFPGAPVESFTNAAPFVKETVQQIMTYSDVQAATYARLTATPMLLSDDIMLLDETTDPTVTKDATGNLVMKKTAALKSGTTDTFTITLETYVKGEVRPVTTTTPVDITLVLDVSGSMAYCMNCGYAESSHNDWSNRCPNKTTTFLQRMDALQTAVNDFIDSTKRQNDQITNSADKHRIAIVKFAGTNRTTVGNETYRDGQNRYNYSQIVQRFTTVDGTNYGQMKTTVNGLSPAGATQINFGLAHASGLVDEQKNSGRKQVVIVFTDGTPTSSSGFQVSVADEALGHANTIKNNGATIYTISVANGSNVGAGLAIPSFPTRSTDGQSISSTYKNWFKSQSVSGPNNNVRTISDTAMFGLMNRFMHLLSSNNPKAQTLYGGRNEAETSTEKATGQYNGTTKQWESYYLVPTSDDDLTAIFGQISNGIEGGSKSELGTDAVVEDIVSKYFNVPAGATGITAKSVECTGVDDDGDFTWSTSSTAITKGIKYDATSRTLDVSGFNFKGHFVSEEGRDKDKYLADGETLEPGKYKGRKLVISFDVKANNFFLGGNGVITNDAAIVKNGEGTTVGTFYQPAVDVPLIDLTIEWKDQHIYQTNAANIATLFENATVTGRNNATKSLPEVFDSNNNKYVDTVFTITETGTTNVIGKYTIPAGKTFSQGTWESEAYLYPVLSADKSYEINWTMTPTSNGTVAAYDTSTDSEHTDAIATVYVYNPVITYQDTEKNYGADKPIYDSENKVSVQWVNGTVGTVDAPDTEKSTVTENAKYTKEAVMKDKAPVLDITYTPEAGAINSGKIATGEDFYVNVGVTANGVDLVDTGYVTFVHENCTIVDGCHPEKGEATFNPANGEFIIHIRTMPLTITKEAYTGTTFDTGETFIFNVKGITKDVTDHINMDVVISGEGSITIDNLPVGDYTITEDTSWSYRYDVVDKDGNPTADNQTIKLGTVDSVKFINKAKDDKWLHDEAYSENSFSGHGTTNGTITVTEETYYVDSNGNLIPYKKNS